MEKRAEKLTGMLQTDACLVLSEVMTRYLSGFDGAGAGVMLICRSAVYYLIDSRYIESAENFFSGSKITTVKLEKFKVQLRELLARHGVKTVATEAEYVSVALLGRLQSDFPGIRFITDGALDKTLRDMRMIKSPEELEIIKKAQRITDDAFLYSLGIIKEGRTEKSIALDMEIYMRKKGSEGVAFDIIAASGENSSVPHAVPTDRKLCAGDLLTLDFGARVEGYNSDMTRTVALGSLSDEKIKAYNTVLSAQKLALSQIAPGKKCSEIDKLVRDYIYSQGYEGCFSHALGHSVGTEIHEYPTFSSRCDEILAAGTIMTVEPGIYIKGKFGIRIEDMVYLTKDGTRNLTESTKELIIL